MTELLWHYWKKDFRFYEDFQLREFLDMNNFCCFMKLHAFVIVSTYFEWLDILILYKEIYDQILVWGDMKADNLSNINTKSIIFAEKG